VNHHNPQLLPLGVKDLKFQRRRRVLVRHEA
jgi:hypothetical protein